MASTSDGQVNPMNAMADMTVAHRFTRRLEDAEALRQRRPVSDARRAVAVRLGVAPGTLENIRRFRTKVVPHWLMARIRAAFVAELQAEIGRLEHEIHLALQIGVDPREDNLAKAQAQLVETRALLNGGAR